MTTTHGHPTTAASHRPCWSAPTCRSRELAIALARVINAGDGGPGRRAGEDHLRAVRRHRRQRATVLLLMAVLVVVVAGIGILVSIYNSMSDRRHEIAVMRALGAGRMTVMARHPHRIDPARRSGGGVSGLLLGHGLIGASRRPSSIRPACSSPPGVPTGRADPDPGADRAGHAGRLPARVSAYRTDVAKALIAAP